MAAIRPGYGCVSTGHRIGVMGDEAFSAKADSSVSESGVAAQREGALDHHLGAVAHEMGQVGIGHGRETELRRS